MPQKSDSDDLEVLRFVTCSLSCRQQWCLAVELRTAARYRSRAKIVNTLRLDEVKRRFEIAGKDRGCYGSLIFVRCSFSKRFRIAFLCPCEGVTPVITLSRADEATLKK